MTTSLERRSISVFLPKVAMPAEVQMIRSEMGLTQKELSERMGVTEFSVWRWEAGKREITESHTLLLRRLYSQHLDETR